jgi:hypothetical protein
LVFRSASEKTKNKRRLRTAANDPILQVKTNTNANPIILTPAIILCFRQMSVIGGMTGRASNKRTAPAAGLV